MWVSEEPGTGSTATASAKPRRDIVMADVSDPDPKSEEAATRTPESEQLSQLLGENPPSSHNRISWGLGLCLGEVAMCRAVRGLASSRQGTF